MIAMLRDAGPPSRLSTGIDQLDAVLGGGIPRYAAVFIRNLVDDHPIPSERPRPCRAGISGLCRLVTAVRPRPAHRRWACCPGAAGHRAR